MYKLEDLEGTSWKMTILNIKSLVSLETKMSSDNNNTFGTINANVTLVITPLALYFVVVNLNAYTRRLSRLGIVKIFFYTSCIL